MTTSPSFDRDRDLGMTDWISEHPVNGRDVAHLLLYPNHHNIDTEMPQVASALGLASAVDGPASVPVEQAKVTLRDDIVHVLFGDDDGQPLSAQCRPTGSTLRRTRESSC